ncbi:MAG: VacJ family lipoprotein [Thiotrichaceae bacterium]
MKSPTWFIVILAVLTSGCAVSEKTPSSNYVTPASARLSSPKSDKPAGPFANDDFDLLEEELAEQMIEIADPLEPLNRIMYHVNDTLYFWVLKPVTEVYKNITPEPARIGIRNFFHNLTTPIRFVNCHLQGKTAAADMELNRFLINTTAGILGFGEPAKDQHGLEPPKEEDLGQTLARYGLGNGFYIVWPLLGPSTVRDSVGTVGGLFLNPVFYVESTEATISISTVKFTNEKSFHIGEYETFKSAALDPYVAMREVYIQYRNKQIKE